MAQADQFIGKYRQLIKGSLEPGKLADICFHDGRLSETETAEFAKLKTAMTLADGEVVYDEL